MGKADKKNWPASNDKDGQFRRAYEHAKQAKGGLQDGFKLLTSAETIEELTAGLEQVNKLGEAILNEKSNRKVKTSAESKLKQLEALQQRLATAKTRADLDSALEAADSSDQPVSGDKSGKMRTSYDTAKRQLQLLHAKELVAAAATIELCEEALEYIDKRELHEASQEQSTLQARRVELEKLVAGLEAAATITELRAAIEASKDKQREGKMGDAFNQAWDRLKGREKKISKLHSAVNVEMLVDALDVDVASPGKDSHRLNEEKEFPEAQKKLEQLHRQELGTVSSSTVEVKAMSPEQRKQQVDTLEQVIKRADKSKRVLQPGVLDQVVSEAKDKKKKIKRLDGLDVSTIEQLEKAIAKAENLNASMEYTEEVARQKELLVQWTACHDTLHDAVTVAEIEAAKARAEQLSTDTGLSLETGKVADRYEEAEKRLKKRQKAAGKLAGAHSLEDLEPALRESVAKHKRLEEEGFYQEAHGRHTSLNKIKQDLEAARTIAALEAALACSNCAIAANPQQKSPQMVIAIDAAQGRLAERKTVCEQLGQHKEAGNIPALTQALVHASKLEGLEAESKASRGSLLQMQQEELKTANAIPELETALRNANTTLDLGFDPEGALKTEAIQARQRLCGLLALEALGSCQTIEGCSTVLDMAMRVSVALDIKNAEFQQAVADCETRREQQETAKAKLEAAMMIVALEEALEEAKQLPEVCENHEPLPEAAHKLANEAVKDGQPVLKEVPPTKDGRSGLGVAVDDAMARYEIRKELAEQLLQEEQVAAMRECLIKARATPGLEAESDAGHAKLGKMHCEQLEKAQTVHELQETIGEAHASAKNDIVGFEEPQKQAEERLVAAHKKELTDAVAAGQLGGLVEAVNDAEISKLNLGLEGIGTELEVAIRLRDKLIAMENLTNAQSEKACELALEAVLAMRAEDSEVEALACVVEVRLEHLVAMRALDESDCIEACEQAIAGANAYKANRKDFQPQINEAKWRRDLLLKIQFLDERVKEIKTRMRKYVKALDGLKTALVLSEHQHWVKHTERLQGNEAGEWRLNLGKKSSLQEQYQISKDQEKKILAAMAKYVGALIANGDLLGKDVCDTEAPYARKGTIKEQTCGFIFMCCRTYLVESEAGKEPIRSDVEGDYFIDDTAGKAALQAALGSGSKQQVEAAIQSLLFFNNCSISTVDYPLMKQVRDLTKADNEELLSPTSARSPRSPRSSQISPTKPFFSQERAAQAEAKAEAQDEPNPLPTAGATESAYGPVYTAHN